MDKLKALFIKYYDILVYLIFGVLTTVVNYLVYLPCYNILGFSSSVSNMIAWAVAVVFAFVTNKPLVFRSHDWSAGVVVPELIKFVGTRIGSGGLETLILLLAVDVLGMNGNVWKLITSVLVVILNYVGSKLLVFRKK
jgi:putative flippase GtrA